MFCAVWLGLMFSLFFGMYSQEVPALFVDCGIESNVCWSISNAALLLWARCGLTVLPFQGWLDANDGGHGTGILFILDDCTTLVSWIPSPNKLKRSSRRPRCLIV